MGTDAWFWDAPFSFTARRWAETQDPAIIWEGHKAGSDIGYYQIEKLHGLEALPPFGFTVSCFPVKIKNAGVGWIRAVAIFAQGPHLPLWERGGGEGAFYPCNTARTPGLGSLTTLLSTLNIMVARVCLS